MVVKIGDVAAHGSTHILPELSAVASQKKPYCVIIPL